MTFSTLPRRWRTVLILSLGLNVMIVSLSLGALLGDDGKRVARARRAEPLVWALPDTDRKALRTALPRTSRDERRERFEDLLDALRADPFDPDRVRTLLSEQRALGAERTKRAETAIIDHLSTMSVEDRDAYARRLVRAIRTANPRR